MNHQASSHASIINGKQIERGVAESLVNMVECPLQKYLFGFSVELQQTGKETKRVTRRELLIKNDIVQENHTAIYGKENKQANRRYGTHFMKKMLKNVKPNRKAPQLLM